MKKVLWRYEAPKIFKVNAEDTCVLCVSGGFDDLVDGGDDINPFDDQGL